MRLLTHNMLVCGKKSCNKAGSNNFPLVIKPVKVEKVESEFNKEFIARMLPKLEWKALVLAAGQLGVVIPPELPPTVADDPTLLANIHTVLLDIHLLEGELVCPNCARAYPVKDGIPNMLLNEDEV